MDGELHRALGARRVNRDIDQLEGHAIICGCGRMATSLARELEEAGQPVVAIDSLGGAAPLAEESDRYLLIHGDAIAEETERRPCIPRPPRSRGR